MKSRSRYAASFAGLSALMLLILVLSGCDKRALEEARQEARDAKLEKVKLEKNLADAIQEISALKAELDAVRGSRDEFQEKLDALKQERDEALTLAEQAQEVITQLTTRASGHAGARAALEKQVEELQALVDEQQATIEELRQGQAGRITAGQPPEEMGLGETVPDVNEPGTDEPVDDAPDS
jgi:DNA repair exonuclease SbcCD ATPase subunit